MLPGESPSAVAAPARGDATRTDPLGAAEPSGRGPDLPALVGRFAIRSVLGEGAYGIVYLAYDPRLDREVALKVAKTCASDDSRRVERFQREAAAAAQLRHPNIVPVFDSGRDGGRDYIASAYIAGQTLEDAIGSGLFDYRRSAEVVRRLAEALAYAHSQGVVHRDVKPANVMLDEQGQPLLMDFGLAARPESDGTLTRDGAVLGTPLYMAPEQATGATAVPTPAGDQYSLGVLLYELLTGRPPFAGTAELLQFLHQNQEPPPPRRLRRGLPRDLEAVCLKCLNKSPADRYADCQALADDLRRFLEKEQTHARPLGLVERLARWCRREPRLAVAFAVAAVAILGLIGLGFWFSASIGASAEREAAEKAHASAEEFHRLVIGVRPRSEERAPGWTEANLSDLADAAQRPLARDYAVQLRTDLARTLGGVDLIARKEIAHGLTAEAVAIHPNGVLLALGQSSAAKKGQVWLIDLHDDSVARRLTYDCWQHTRRAGDLWDGIISLAFSPDGRWLVAGSKSGWVHWWDLLAATNQATTDTAAHTDEVFSVVFNRAGTALYSCSLDKTVKRWAADRDWQHPLAFTGPDGFYRLIVPPDVPWVLASAREGHFFLKADTLEPVPFPYTLNTPGLQELSPDGRAFTQRFEGGLDLRDTTSGRILRRFFTLGGEPADEAYINDVAFSPDGTLLATASRPAEHVKLWDAVNGQLLLELSLPDSACCVPIFGPNGRSLIVTGRNKTFRFTLAGRQEASVMAQQFRPVRAFAPAPDGTWLALAVESSGGKEWLQLRTWRCKDQVHVGPDTPLRFSDDNACVAVHPDGKVVAAKLWDNIAIRGPGGEVSTLPVETGCDITFDAAGRLWTTNGNVLQAWDVTTGREEFPKWVTTSIGNTGVSALRQVRAGRKYVLVGGGDGAVRCFQPTSSGIGDPLGKWQHDRGQVFAVALSPDESLAAAGTQRGDVCIFRLPSGEVVADLPAAHRDRVIALAFAGNGIVASGSPDRRIRLWRADGTEILTFHTTGRVRQLAFTPDGMTLLYLIENESAIRSWNLSQLWARMAALNLSPG